MKASIIKIGNSKGIRIPKALLEESGLGNDVDISVQRGEIVIKNTPAKQTLNITKEYAKFKKQYAQTLKNLADR